MEKSRDLFDLSSVFLGFQAEDFGKLSAPVFRIFLDRFRAPGRTIRPISFNFSVFFQFVGREKYEKPTFSLYFQKNRP